MWNLISSASDAGILNSFKNNKYSVEKKLAPRTNETYINLHLCLNFKLFLTMNEGKISPEKSQIITKKKRKTVSCYNSASLVLWIVRKSQRICSLDIKLPLFSVNFPTWSDQYKSLGSTWYFPPFYMLFFTNIPSARCRLCSTIK